MAEHMRGKGRGVSVKRWERLAVSKEKVGQSTVTGVGFVPGAGIEALVEADAARPPARRGQGPDFVFFSAGEGAGDPFLRGIPLSGMALSCRAKLGIGLLKVNE